MPIGGQARATADDGAFRCAGTSEAWTDAYVANPGISWAALDGRALRFTETGQNIQELNGTAAFIWEALSTGRSPADVESMLLARGASPQEAEAFVGDLLGPWLAAGDLYPAAVDAEGRGLGRRLSLGPFGAEIMIEGDLDPHPFDLSFGHLWGDRAPLARSYRFVRRGALAFGFDGRRCIGAARAQDAAALLKAQVTEGYLALVQGGFAVHGACLELGGAAWLLLGDPGAGKSTLTAALTAGGFGYASDDLTILHDSGRVSGAPFALTLKEGAWSLCRSMAPEVETLPVFVRGDGLKVRYLRPRTIVEGQLPVRGVLFLARDARSGAALVDLDRVEALKALLTASYSPNARMSAPSFRAVAGMLAGARVARLVYSDLADAAALVLREAAHG